jgi:hypothetical protein
VSTSPDDLTALLLPDEHLEHLERPEQFEQEEADRHLRVVPPRRRSRPRLALWVGSMLSVGSLFLLVAFNVFMVQGQFRLDHLAQQRAAEQRQYEQDRALTAALSAPPTIVQKALALGLVYPSQGIKYLNAPAAAPKQTADQTSVTTRKNYSDTKPALAASP